MHEIDFKQGMNGDKAMTSTSREPATVPKQGASLKCWNNQKTLYFSAGSFFTYQDEP